MAVNNIENINLNSVEYIFNGDFFAIEIFKNLLIAVTNDTLEDSVNSVDDKTLYTYILVRPMVEDFINSTIYEDIYKSDMYDGLIKSLIDLYACLYTVVYIRKSVTNVDTQPDEVVNEYLKSFGFPALSIFNSIQKREICRTVYGYLRKKGTPHIIEKLLSQLGFTNFCISEFWITTNSSGDYILDPEIISKNFNNIEGNENNWDLFYKNKSYTLNEIREMDPLLILEDSDITNLLTDDMMTLPAKSSYYQLSVAVSDTADDKLFSSMLYAIIKKDLFNYSLNEINKEISYEPYTASKISVLDLVYAWAFINESYSSIYDVFGLNVTDKSNTFDIEGKHKHFDMEMVYDTIANRSIVERIVDDGDDYDSSEINYDYNITDKLITENVFGWNCDITSESINNILKDIKLKYDSLFSLIRYYPSKLTYNLDKIVMNNNKYRFGNVVSSANEYFIAPALFYDIDDTLANFKIYNPTFYSWVESKINLYRSGSVEKNTLCIELIIQILKSLETYIYNKCGLNFNLEQYLISNKNFKSIVNKLDKSFAPYHAKMLDPFYVHIIRELPYDQILISDSDNDKFGPTVKGRCKYNNLYWKSSYSLYSDDEDDFSSEAEKIYKKIPITISNNLYMPSFGYESDYILTNCDMCGYSGYKTKLAPYTHTTNVKQTFVVDVNPQKTEFVVYAKIGTDITTPKSIMRLIPLENWNTGYNRIIVEESMYNSKLDGPSMTYIRTLPNANLELDLNTFDDPRWNDRFDVIKICATDGIYLEMPEAVIRIGMVSIADIIIDL